MEVYTTPSGKGSLHRKSIAFFAASACAVLLSFGFGHEMARWRRSRIDAISDAYSLTPDAPADAQRKAIVAMQREVTKIVEALRRMESGGDADAQVHAANARAWIHTVSK